MSPLNTLFDVVNSERRVFDLTIDASPQPDVAADGVVTLAVSC